MLKTIILSSLFFCKFFAVYGDSMIGPGKWNLLKVEKKQCSINEVVLDLSIRKYNRSVDMFTGSMYIFEDLDESFGARVDVCKFVDGGCKQYQVISDDSFASMMNKYAENNLKEMFDLMHIDPPEFPIKKGNYTIEEGYLFDWDELPDECPYGHYIADCCAMKGPVEVGCVTLEIEFVKHDGDADSDEE